MTQNLLLEELLALLKKEIILYHELAAILKKEEQSILELSLEKLHETVKEKETCVLKLRILEEQRSILLERISRQVCLPSAESTLSNLIKTIGEPYGSRLNVCYTNLKELAATVSKVNKENGRFVEHSLACTNSSLSLLSYLNAYNSTYLSSGKVKPADNYNFGSLSQEI